MKKLLTMSSVLWMTILFLFVAKPATIQAEDFDVYQVGDVITQTISPKSEYAFNVEVQKNDYYTLEVMSDSHEEYWTYMEGMEDGYYQAGEKMNCYIRNDHEESDLQITFRLVAKTYEENGQLARGKEKKFDMKNGQVHRFVFCADKTTTYAISYKLLEEKGIGYNFKIFDANMKLMDTLGFYDDPFMPGYSGYRLVKCKKDQIYYICVDYTSSESMVSASMQFNYGYPTSIKSISPSGSGLKITWKKCSDASGYYIYRFKSSGFYTEPTFHKSKPIKTITKASTCSYTDSKLTNGKTYSYYVIPYKKVNSKTKIYGTCTYPEKYFYMSVVSGVKASNVKGKKIKISWKKNSKCMGYQVKYVLGSKSKTVYIPRYNELKKTITGLKKGKTYKVYVRAYYKDDDYTIFYSKWSSAKSVKVKK